MATYERAQKARVLHYTRLEKIAGTNTLTYWDHLQVAKKMKCCKYSTSCFIHNTYFLQLMKSPNKREYYIRIGWKGLPGTNTKAYLADFNEESK